MFTLCNDRKVEILKLKKRENSHKIYRDHHVAIDGKYHRTVEQIQNKYPFVAQNEITDEPVLHENKTVGTGTLRR